LGEKTSDLYSAEVASTGDLSGIEKLGCRYAVRTNFLTAIGEEKKEQKCARSKSEDPDQWRGLGEREGKASSLDFLTDAGGEWSGKKGNRQRKA